VDPSGLDGTREELEAARRRRPPKPVKLEPENREFPKPRKFPNCPEMKPRGKKLPWADGLFVFGSMGGHDAGGASSEVVGIWGYDREQGFYGEDILAHGKSWSKGKWTFEFHAGGTTSTTGEATGINLFDVVAPNGVGGGFYYDTHGHFGVYGHISGGAMGEHGAIGVGVPLNSGR
jgi:hypothetical protein